MLKTIILSYYWFSIEETFIDDSVLKLDSYPKNTPPSIFLAKPISLDKLTTDP